MSRHRSIAVAVAAIAAITISTTLTGCDPAKNSAAGGSNTAPAGNGSGSGAPAATAAASAAATGGAPAAGGGDKRINVCTVLSLSAVVSASGRSYSTATQKTTDSPVPGDHCDYGGPDSAMLSLDISVFHGTPDTVYQDLQGGSNAAGETMTNVSGFGDKAFTDEDDLVVVYGSDVIAVQDSEYPPGASPLTLAVMEQLVSTIHAAL